MFAPRENTSDINNINNGINNDDATMTLKASKSTDLDSSYQLDCNVIKVKIINYEITNRHILAKLHRAYRDFEHSIRLFIEKDHKMAYIYFNTSHNANMAKLNMPVLNLYGYSTPVELTNGNHSPRDGYSLEAILYSSNQNVSPDADQHMSNTIDDNEMSLNVTTRNVHLLPPPGLIRNRPVLQFPSMYPALRPRYFLHGSTPPSRLLHGNSNHFMPKIAPQHPMDNNEGFQRKVWRGGYGPQTLTTSNDDISEDLREIINRRKKEHFNQSKNNNSNLSMQQDTSKSDFVQSSEKSPNHPSTDNDKSSEWLRMILCKNSQFPAKLCFISGDESVIPSAITDENSTSTFRLTLRLRFSQILFKHTQNMHVRAIFLAKSCSADSVPNYDTSIQIRPLNYLVKYFSNLEAAGVKPLAGTCSEESNELLIAFPLCEYSATLLKIDYENLMTESEDNLIIAIVSEKCIVE